MRIISKKVLKDFWEKHSDSEQTLKSWYFAVKNSTWKSSNDVKEKFASASIIANNRVVFNIKGNKYRLIVKVHYNTGIVYIRFVGTHAEYNKIDAENI